MQVEGEAGRALQAEQALPGQPGGHPVSHLLGRHVDVAADHRAGVLPSLQQARYEDRLEDADGYRLVLVVDQRDELLGQPGAVLLEPAGTLLKVPFMHGERERC